MIFLRANKGLTINKIPYLSSSISNLTIDRMQDEIG